MVSKSEIFGEKNFSMRKVKIFKVTKRQVCVYTYVYVCLCVQQGEPRTMKNLGECKPERERHETEGQSESSQH